MDDILYTVALVLSCITNGHIYFRFMDEVYGKKYGSRRLYYGLQLLFTIINFLISICKISILNVISSVIFLFGLGFFFYDYKRKNMLFKNIIFLIYLIIVEIVVYAIISSDIKESTVYFIGGMLTNAFYLSTYVLIIHILKKFKHTWVSTFLHALLIFIAVFETITLIILNDRLTNSGSGYIVFFISLGFMVIDAGISYLFFMFANQSELKRAYDLQMQQNHMLQRYSDNVHQKYNESRKVIHDIRKHLDVIRRLDTAHPGIKSNYVEELDTLIALLGFDFECSNKTLNVILADKILICKRKGITLQLNIDDVDIDFMKNTDITILFVNLLDNSIEACELLEVEKRSIKVNLKMSDKFIILNISNSSKLPIRHKGAFKSTKSGHSGIGLQNIKAVVENYYGDVQFNYTDTDFFCFIIIPIPFTGV